jgi:hypothetical protein
MFVFLADVRTESGALRVLRRHWGGWLFAGTNFLSAALVWADVPSVPRYTGYEIFASAYFCSVATAAAWLTWLLVRRRKPWAGGALLSLISLAIVMAFVAALDEGTPPSSPFLFLRLWIALSVFNAMRACRTLKAVEAGYSSAVTTSSAAIVEPKVPKALERWKRAWLFGSACWLVAIGFWLVLFDPSGDLVGGESWKVVALFVGPPLFTGIAIWGYRRFVAVADQLAVEPMTAAGRQGFKGDASAGALDWKPRAIGIALAVALGGTLIWGIPKLYDVVSGAGSARETQASAEELALGKMQVSAAELESLMAETARSTRTIEPPLPNLDRVLEFDEPGDCVFGSNLRRIIRGLTTTGGDQILPGTPFRVQGYDAWLVPTYHRSEDGLVTATLPLTGTWHGLKVSRIYTEVQFHRYFEIRFLEPPERIRQVLNEAGFVLPAVGERRVTSEVHDFQSWQAVVELPGGGALACF